MRKSVTTLAALAAVLSFGVAGAETLSPSQNIILAQAPAPGANAPGTLPIPGGGVVRGPGAPDSAGTGVPPSGRGAPPAGMTNPPGLGAGTGGSNLTPGGEIRPGSPSQGGGTGGSTGSASGGDGGSGGGSGR